MIYATPYNPTTRQCTTSSVKTGFETLEEVVAAVPEPVGCYQAMIVYDGVIFTRFPWRIEPCES